METMSSSPPPATTTQSRRTRFVCISDTHNRPVKLPKGDVLIHAGDLTNQGSYSEVGCIPLPPGSPLRPAIYGGEKPRTETANCHDKPKLPQADPPLDS